MRLIDADAYKEVLYGLMPKFDEENDKTCIEGQTIHACMQYLDDMPTATLLPTADKIAIEDLIKMDGEPVYIVEAPIVGKGEWMIWDTRGGLRWFGAEDYGKTWCAYYNKPKEEKS